MKYRYTKYIGDPLDDIDIEDLVSKLSDLLLASGFGNPRGGMDDEERTMQALHDAILDALFNGGVLPEETIEQLLGDPADGDQDETRSKLEELIQQIIEKMGEEGYITMPPDLARSLRPLRFGQAGGRFPIYKNNEAIALPGSGLPSAIDCRRTPYPNRFVEEKCGTSCIRKRRAITGSPSYSA